MTTPSLTLSPSEMTDEQYMRGMSAIFRAIDAGLIKPFSKGQRTANKEETFRKGVPLRK